LDTRFRTALDRMIEAGRLQAYTEPVDPHLEAAAVMKRRDGEAALLFTDVKGYHVPVVGNFLSCRENCEAAFGVDFHQIRQFIGRALGNPLPPRVSARGPAQEFVHLEGIDICGMLPVLHHTAADSGRYITAGVVIVRDPDTGVYNASYHRLQVVGPDRVAIKLDFGRHLRLAVERAQRQGNALPVAVCIGTDLALQYTAATMGSQMPEHADELAVAGGLHRFHAVIQVEKKSSQQDGLQRNAIQAAFGALKDLDLVIVVDEDIDIRDPHDVEYALATRMEASRDLIVMPEGRGHEYVRIGRNGIRAKLGIDATVPFAEKERFARCAFEPVSIAPQNMSFDPQLLRARLGF
jgi:3-polyprenyl-4-hydroxybenzoate decarboxylase